MPLSDLLSKIRFAGIRINRPPQIHRCEPAWRWQPPPLEDFDLWYILEGVGEICLAGQKFPVTSNRCFILTPGITLDASHDPAHPLRVFAVHFDLVNTRGHKVHRRIKIPPVDVDDPPFFEALARRCDTDWRDGSAAAQQRAHILLAQMLLHLGADSGRPGSLDISDPLIAKLTREVRETPGQRRSVQELAEQAGLSRSQLTRRFTRATGLSPEAFLIHARIDRSRYLLRETPMPVAAIAQSLGYCDTFYFCRQFKAITHQTPSRFRAGRGTK